MLTFYHFQKSFSSSPVISIPDLSLKEGIYWLQGENGAGKTTLLKSAAGLIPFSGSITVNDIDIRKHRLQYRRLVNWADAEPAYPEFLTGRDLIDFYEQTLTANPDATKPLIDAFGLDKFIHQKVSTYSSGMTKKLSLVLAFIGQPTWILLDEPLITLDVMAVDTCLNVIDYYHKKGTSFIISSHQPFTDKAPFPSINLTIKDKGVTVL